ncbi:MAG: phosphonoacetaldehyde reductase [Quinella sp. 1Q5]|nr:phosphonoacetaldehyde reductase [Quinella sp. 1Q5]
MEQILFGPSNNYAEVDKYIETYSGGSIFLVCGKSFEQMRLYSHLQELKEKGLKIVRFSDFRPNPSYESVVEGVEKFRKEKTGLILATGGGSALDVAKCIKLYRRKLPHEHETEVNETTLDIKFLAVPTTAGTGSEATKFAVIYQNGEKQSVTDESIVPDAVLFDPSVLTFLPMYHRKATMLDALCHGIESFWSINATAESQVLSEKAIVEILKNMERFLKNDPEGNKRMMLAAYTAGKAINMTQTTAGHAMCYKLTSLYGIAHGHAAALCIDVLWPWMSEHTSACSDVRGENYLKMTLARLGKLFDAEGSLGYINFQKMLKGLKLGSISIRAEDIEFLSNSVNHVRLKNHPVNMTKEDIRGLYENIRKRNKFDES